MAEQIISPGVFTRENDQSFLPQGIGAIGAVVIGPTVKGPAFIPMVIQNGFGQFERKFGGLSQETYIPYTVREYLKSAGTVTVIRVLGGGGWSFKTGEKLLAALIDSGSSEILTVFHPSKSTINGNSQGLGKSSISPTTVSLTGSFGLILSGSNIEPGGKQLSASINPTATDYIEKSLGKDANNSKTGVNTYEESGYPYLNFKVRQAALTGSNIILSVNTSDIIFKSSYADEGYNRASTPWVTSQFLDSNKTTSNLFKVHTLADGTSTNKDYKISVTNLQEPGDIEGVEQYSKFSIIIRQFGDSDKTPLVLEQFNNCTLDPNDVTYVARVIGDRYQQYNSTTGKVDFLGDYPNNSEYCRIEVAPGVDGGSYSPKLSPKGFKAMNQTIKGFAGLPTTAAAVATGSLTIVNSFGETVDDEFQITVGSTTYRFIAADPAGGLPVDSPPIYFLATGSDAATYITNLVLEIDSAAIGVDTTDASGTAIEVTASSAGTSGNAITVDTGSGLLFSPVLTLEGGTAAIGATIAYLPSMSYQSTQEIDSAYNAKSYLGIDYTAKDNENYFKPVPDAPVVSVQGVFNVENYSGHPSSSLWVGSLSESIDPTGMAGPTAGQLQFSVALQGGSDGMNPDIVKQVGEYIEDSNLYGMDLSSGGAVGSKAYKKALDIISNQDEYDINMVVLPGVLKSLHTPVTTHAINMAEARGDTFYVMDLDAVDSSVNTAVNDSSGLNSSYTATYFPWVKILDDNINKPIYVPPSVIVPGAIAASDNLSAEWFAPAGLNRGALGGVLEAKIRLNHAERDKLYDANVNPIATFPQTGVAIWGQKTLQQKSSALDRVNVRRLLITVKKYIASSSRYLIFEQNTIQTRNRFLNIVNPYLETIQQRQGLYAFRVVMDESNNTSAVIDRNELVGQIYLQPTKTAEFIILDFNVLPTGATFPS